MSGGKDSHIVLQVYEQEKKKDRKEQVVWGPMVSEYKWIKWNIDILGDVTIQLLPRVLGKDEYGQTASCSQNKVILKKDNHYGKFLEVEEGIKKKGTEFKVDLQSCRDKEKCNIVFSENSFFQWKTGFQPKVTIPLEEIR